MADPLIDYYKVLEVDPKASQQQIRDAYKKAALKHHPDRVPADSPERAARTKRFQRINDAYYTLSDPSRRRDYDSARQFHAYTGTSSSSQGDDIPGSFDSGADDGTGTGTGTGGGGFNFQSFPWSSFFGSGASAKSNPAEQEEAHNRFSNEQFGSVFEDMLRDEGMAEGESAAPTTKFWSLVGGLSGGAMGFIVANFPGAVAGAVAGNRLGAVRDARGKSVYSVFQELPQADKARMLSDLAAKVFAHAVGS